MTYAYKQNRIDRKNRVIYYRAHISQEIEQKFGLSQRESLDVIDSLFEEIARAVMRDEEVCIEGFGNFLKGVRSSWVFNGRQHAAIYRILFRPSKILKNRVKRAMAHKIVE